MAFNKKVWSNGEVLDAVQMNRIETGIDDLSNGNSGSASPTWEYNIYKDNLGLPLMEEIDLDFETEWGTLNDDTSHITGDKVASIKRRRLTEILSTEGFEELYLDLPDNMGGWINYYDSSKNYLRSCASTFYGNQVFKTGGDVAYIWLIFRTKDGLDNTPTNDDMSKCRIYGTKQIQSDDNVTVEPELLETISVVAKNAHNLDIIMEGGTINSENGVESDTITEYKTKIRSGLVIAIDSATKISFNTYLPKCNSGTVIFYDYNMNVLRSTPMTKSYGLVDLTGDEKYFRVTFNVGIPTLKSINVTIFNSKRPPKEVKKKLWKTVESTYNCIGTTYPVTSSQKTCCNTIRIFLPPNYSATGPNKVPLIYYLPGSGNWYGWTHPNWPGTNETIHTGLTYCMNEGFAVCCIYGWGDYYHGKYSPGSSHPYPIRTCLQVIQDGIDWLVSRYNIDGTNIHVMSKSQGGQNAAYWVSRPFPGLRSVGMCAPVVDYFSMPAEPMYNPPRKCIVEDLALEGDTDWFSHGTGEYEDDPYWTYKEKAKEFILLNKNKFAGMNEAWVDLHGGTIEEYIEESWASGRLFWIKDDGTPGYRPENANIELDDSTIYMNADKYTKTGRVPCKLWSGDKDDNTPHWKNVEFIKQLQNGGSEATLRVYSGGHSSFDYGGSNSGTTSLGIPYSGVRNYFIENMQFIKEHMPN